MQIILLHVEQQVPLKSLSEQFGINLSLLYVWRKQYLECGAERLRSQNGIPRSQPTVKKKEERNMSYTYNSKMDTTFINKAIGALIREYREKSGYSQNDLAEKSGLSQQNISQVELGKRNIASDDLIMLSLLLGFDTSEIGERVVMEMAEITAATEADIPDIHAFDNAYLSERLIESIKENRIFIMKGSGKILGVMRYNFFLESIPCLDVLILDSTHTKMDYFRKMLGYWEFRMRDLGYLYVMVTMFADQAEIYSLGKFSYQKMGEFSLPLADESLLVFTKELNQHED